MKKNIILTVILVILSAFTAYVVLTMEPESIKHKASQIPNKLKKEGDSTQPNKANIIIASQEWLGYSPINILKNIENINDLVPNSNISIDIFANSDAVFQALNEEKSPYNIACLDIASMLFYNDKLLSNNNEIKMKLLFGLSIPQYELFTVNNKRYKNIASLGINDKIAISSIGATDHIILAMAAKKYLKNAHKLDRNVVAMSDNKAFDALSKKEITAHFASSNGIKKGLKEYGKSILKSKDFIDNASIICTIDEKFYNQYPAEVDNLTLTMNEIITLINNNEESILKRIAELNNIDIKEVTPAQLKYSTEIYGVQKLYDFMVENKYLKNKYELDNLSIKKSSSEEVK